MSEAILKLQPNRTMQLKGFEFGSSAAMHSAGPTSFKVSGVWREAGHFAVVVLYEAHNQFEHPRLRHLPDTDFAGMLLSFDVQYTGLEPLDSTKFPTIDWAYLDVERPNGTTTRILLFDHAELASGTWPVAWNRFPLENNGMQQFDRVTLWYLNLAFDYIVPTPVPTLRVVVDDLVRQINTANWPVLNPSMAIIATAENDSTVKIEAGRFGTVQVAGKVLTLLTGMGFQGMRFGDRIIVNGVERVVESTGTQRQITLTQDIGGFPSVNYLAQRGGRDGTFLAMYSQSKNARLRVTPSNQQIVLQTAIAPDGSVNPPEIPTVWRILLDFTALGIDQIRQMWLTFAPALRYGLGYTDVPGTEWEAAYTNWSVSDPQGKRPLKVAGPGSVRIEDSDYWVTYAGPGWQRKGGDPGAFAFYSRGSARATSTSGDTATIRYFCQFVHSLWVGTLLYTDRGIFTASLDGDAATQHDAYLTNDVPIPSRIRIRQNVPAGEHVVVLTATDLANVASSGFAFLVDFLEAAVESDVPDSPGDLPGLAPATDYDTDISYKVPPQRLLWWFDKLGWKGRLNHYVGVFWWNQRKQAGAAIPEAEIEFTGAFAATDQVFLRIAGLDIGKTVFPADDTFSIARHFALFINATFVGIFATLSGNKMQLFNRSSLSAYSFTLTARIEGITPTTPPLGTGLVRITGSLQGGAQGTWLVDPVQVPTMAKGALDWHADFYKEIQARGLRVSTAFSMEVTNPPDGTWGARYQDGTIVETATGFGTLKSTHCAFNSAIQDYYKRVYGETAGQQVAAGLIPELQFGEFTWWYFTGPPGAPAPTMAYYDAGTAAAAVAALGRPLATLVDPDENPANNQADADFLADRLANFVFQLHNSILLAYLNTVFEILLPLDVNGPAPSPVAKVGGRLNQHVNIPAQWKLGPGYAPFAIMKIEALAFGTTDRNLNLALVAMRGMLPGWPAADTYYLVPVQNGGCPFENELRMALEQRFAGINTWALDHYAYFGWAPGLPEVIRGGSET